MSKSIKVLKIIILLIIVIILSYLFLSLFHFPKISGGGKTINATPKELLFDVTPDKHFKGLIEVNYPEIEVSTSCSYSDNNMLQGVYLTIPTKTFIPDGYLRDKKLFLEFDEDFEFHSSRKNINYMCKTAAYYSKLLEGYSLARFAYKSKYFSASEKLDEKKKRYKLIDNVVLQTIENIVTSAVPVLCLVKFDFDFGSYQKINVKNPSFNPSLLYNGRVPRTHEEIFNKLVLKGDEENYCKRLIKDEDGKYVMFDDSLINSQPINGGKMSVKTGRDQRIISETSKKLIPSYYFLENKMDQTATKRYCQNSRFHIGAEIVTIEEYLQRGMEKIDRISYRDMNEINKIENDISDEDLHYLPDTVDEFYELVGLRSNEYHGWCGSEYMKNRYVTGDDYLTFSEVKRYYDLFVAAFYNISEEYYDVGRWMINRYLWDIKQSLLKGKRLNKLTFNKLTFTRYLRYDKDGNHLEKGKWYEVKDYTEYLDDKGQEKFINFELIYHICVLYTVTPYQMEFINSGKYEIRDDLIPDLTYYDQTLNHLGLTKEQVIDLMNTHPHFRDEMYKPIIVREYIKEEISF
jgi:hypothetical protein